MSATASRRKRTAAAVTEPVCVVRSQFASMGTRVASIDSRSAGSSSIRASLFPREKYD